jgi:hypothetical protein
MDTLLDAINRRVTTPKSQTIGESMLTRGSQ